VWGGPLSHQDSPARLPFSPFIDPKTGEACPHCASPARGPALRLTLGSPSPFGGRHRGMTMREVFMDYAFMQSQEVAFSFNPTPLVGEVTRLYRASARQRAVENIAERAAYLAPLRDADIVGFGKYLKRRLPAEAARREMLAEFKAWSTSSYISWIERTVASGSCCVDMARLYSFVLEGMQARGRDSPARPGAEPAPAARGAPQTPERVGGGKRAREEEGAPGITPVRILSPPSIFFN
jgi:hypothetical protein